jgi:protein-tyrosine phosphatase
MILAEPSVLFVCLGNICRSPMAEGAFRAEAQRAGLGVVIDSAGTAGYHTGAPPDPRAQAMALNHGVDISGLRARQLVAQDFIRFSHVLVMDHANLADARVIVPAGAITRPGLLLDLVAGREGAAVADPYYGGEEHFEATWQDVNAGARALLNLLKG